MAKFFQKKTPNLPIEYPQGTFIKTEDGYFFVINPKKRLRITSLRILESWRPHRVVETTEQAAGYLEIGMTKMKFRDGSLLWCQADAKMYLVSDSKVRHITNPDILAGLGVKHNDAMWVSSAEINIHGQGAPLS